MASRAVVAAVLDRLGPKVDDARTWSPISGDPIPVYGPNERYTTPDNAADFIDVEFPVSVEDQISIGSPGSNVYREEGVFRLIIAAERGKGVDQGLNWAEQLATLFRAKEFAGIQTFALNPPVIDDSNDNGNYFTLGIAVPYQFDKLG